MKLSPYLAVTDRNGCNSVELFNNCRTIAYMRSKFGRGDVSTASLRPHKFWWGTPPKPAGRCDSCCCGANDQGGYTFPSDCAGNVAPWFDQATPASAEFFGFLVDYANMEDVWSGRVAGEGGYPQLTISGRIISSTERGHNYGRRWIQNVLGDVCAGCDGLTIEVQEHCPSEKDQLLLCADPYGQDPPIADGEPIGRRDELVVVDSGQRTVIAARLLSFDPTEAEGPEIPVCAGGRYAIVLELTNPNLFGQPVVTCEVESVQETECDAPAAGPTPIAEGCTECETVPCRCQGEIIDLSEFAAVPVIPEPLPDQPQIPPPFETPLGDCSETVQCALDAGLEVSLDGTIEVDYTRWEYGVDGDPFADEETQKVIDWLTCADWVDPETGEEFEEFIKAGGDPWVAPTLPPTAFDIEEFYARTENGYNHSIRWMDAGPIPECTDKYHCAVERGWEIDAATGEMTVPCTPLLTPDTNPSGPLSDPTFAQIAGYYDCIGWESPHCRSIAAELSPYGSAASPWLPQTADMFPGSLYQEVWIDQTGGHYRARWLTMTDQIRCAIAAGWDVDEDGNIDVPCTKRITPASNPSGPLSDPTFAKISNWYNCTGYDGDCCNSWWEELRGDQTTPWDPEAIEEWYEVCGDKATHYKKFESVGDVANCAEAYDCALSVGLKIDESTGKILKRNGLPLAFGPIPAGVDPFTLAEFRDLISLLDCVGWRDGKTGLAVWPYLQGDGRPYHDYPADATDIFERYYITPDGLRHVVRWKSESSGDFSAEYEVPSIPSNWQFTEGDLGCLGEGETSSNEEVIEVASIAEANPPEEKTIEIDAEPAVADWTLSEIDIACLIPLEPEEFEIVRSASIAWETSPEEAACIQFADIAPTWCGSLLVDPDTGEALEPAFPAVWFNDAGEEIEVASGEAWAALLSAERGCEITWNGQDSFAPFTYRLGPGCERREVENLEPTPDFVQPFVDGEQGVCPIKFPMSYLGEAYESGEALAEKLTELRGGRVEWIDGGDPINPCTYKLGGCAERSAVISLLTIKDPPVPPPEVCYEAPDEVRRETCWIPRLASGGELTIRLSAGGEAVDNAAVRIYEALPQLPHIDTPAGRGYYDSAPTVSHYTVAQVPPGGTVNLDGRRNRATLDCLGGRRVSAAAFVKEHGTGAPYRAPQLKCKQYWVVVDMPCNAPRLKISTEVTYTP